MALKHINGPLRQNFGECCGSKMSTPYSNWPSNLCIPWTLFCFKEAETERCSCRSQWHSQEFCSGGASHWYRQSSIFSYFAQRSFRQLITISGLLPQDITSNIFF